uniref:Receptor kinase-like protein Xa21 n=1 Tax=Triticum aestivum TaxID=4565 RepID=Q0Q5E0_WHEAT|nr:receptor kinase 2 [Triticum aestivum]
MEIRRWLRLLALLTTTTALLLSPSTSTSSSISTADDLPALLSFKSLITKDPLDALSSWTINSSSNGSTHGFCTWTGVKCSSGHPGHVLALRLQGLSLSGTISPFLGNLSRLLALDLSGNKLEGQIPPSLGNCFALRRLNLSFNSLSGAIPPAMGNLSKLVVLAIGSNNISGTIPLSFADLATVTVFNIRINDVHGEIPPWLGNLTALKHLNMGVNMMSGHVPPALSKLIHLQVLNLAVNNLQGLTPPVLFNMSSLESLNFGSNQLSGSIPQDIGSILTNLKKFSLFYNKFEGQIPASLSNISGLELIVLHGNRFQGRIPSNIGQNGRLTVLEVGDNELQATESRDWDFLTSLANCSRLFSVALQLNNLSGIFPNSITPDKLARHKLIHILVFAMVGVFILLGVCIATCCYINKSRGHPRQGQENIPEMYQRISYAELHSATDSFSVENLVGRGSFGSVYKGTFGSGANLITAAVKVLDVQRQGATRSYICECNALKRIRHRKLVKVITVCDSLDHSGSQFKAIVLDFIPNGSLDKWLHPSTEGEFQTPSLMQRLNIALDVAQALEYLHHHIDPPIVHCDVKPSNILLDDNMVAHLGDFGLAKIIKAEESQQIADQSCLVGIKGTIGYLAPEYGMGTEISVEGDVYSYGVLLLEMLTGRRPTDPFFGDTTNLPKYVEMACPGNLLEIMDVNIRCNQEPQATLELFAAPVSRLGLACCRGSARQRINMGDVVKELGAIKRIIMASQNYSSWSTGQ